MTTPSERRDAQRIVVGPDHTVRFLVRGHPFRGVRITNLSLGGCFAMVGARDAGLFPAGTLLEQFTFEHPALPQSPLTAEVRYCLGSEAGSAPMAVLGLGIMFQALAPAMGKRPPGPPGPPAGRGRLTSLSLGTGKGYPLGRSSQARAAFRSVHTARRTSSVY